MIQFFEPLSDPLVSDIQIVQQIGGVDLRLAAATGSVPGDLQGTEDNVNGIEAPESIIGRPDDVFALHRASSAYDAVVASAGASSPESPSGEPAAS